MKTFFTSRSWTFAYLSYELGKSFDFLASTTINLYHSLDGNKIRQI
jgi:hypothetical protein